MYAYAWKVGLKTTYYLRSRPATRIAQAASGTRPVAVAAPTMTAEEQAAAIACSLENPESCEACQ
jgi:ribonucleoside-diphosphate reductase alpha chain